MPTPTTAFNNLISLINTNLPSGQQISASDHRAVENALLAFAEAQWIPGDIKEVHCNDQYIADNFDNTGKGIIGGEREGWAICNGQNGTQNRAGLVSVAYGTTAATISSMAFPSMESPIAPGSPWLGGQKNAVLIAHEHFTISTAGVAGQPAISGASYTNSPMVSSANYGNDSNYIIAAGSTAPTRGKTSTKGANYFGSVQNDAPTEYGINANMQPFIVTLFIQKLPNP